MEFRGTSRRGGLILSLLALCWAGGAPAGAQDFRPLRGAEGLLSVDRVLPGAEFQVAVRVSLNPTWHVNANPPSIEWLIPTTVAWQPPEGVVLDPTRFPDAEQVQLAFEETPLAVYSGTFHLTARGRAAADLPAGERTLTAVVTYQACDDTTCLPPRTVEVTIPIPVGAPGEPVTARHADLFASRPAPAPPTPAPGPDPAAGWGDQGLWGLLLLTFGSGLALNLTPCVYPMIPITISFFGGQAGERRGKVLGLAVCYVLGLCLTYSALGVLAASSGQMLGQLLQNPAVLGGVAGVLVALALSMFGVWEFRLPGFLTRHSRARRGYGGALAMGLVMGIVAAPCIGPFVVGLLTFVGQSGDLVKGFWLFFLLSLGLGTPLLVLAVFSGLIHRLPGAGGWMDWVKKLFGCALLVMALYFLLPLLPRGFREVWGFRLLFAGVLTSAGYLAFLEKTTGAGAFRAVKVGLPVLAALAAGWVFWPAPTGGLEWQTLEPAALARARTEGRPVVIDFTADWCVPCQELKHVTFVDPRVVEKANGFLMLQADVTNSSDPKVQELMRTYNVRGVPTVIFLRPDGSEATDLRLLEFVDPDVFLDRLNRLS